MYKNKINVANKTNSSELVSPYIGFLSIFCTELSAPIGRDALCQRPSTPTNDRQQGASCPLNTYYLIVPQLCTYLSYYEPSCSLSVTVLRS